MLHSCTQLFAWQCYGGPCCYFKNLHFLFFFPLQYVYIFLLLIYLAVNVFQCSSKKSADTYRVLLQLREIKMYPETKAKHFLRTIKEERIESAALTTNSLHSAKNQHVLICCSVRKTCFIDRARSLFFPFSSDSGGLLLSSWHSHSTVHDI